MTYLIWGIDIDYNTLKKMFWNPTDWDWYKTDAEWKIDSKWWPIYIYNYKDGINYNWIKEWIPKTKIRDWHIWWDSEIQLYYILSKIREYQVCT